MNLGTLTETKKFILLIALMLVIFTTFFFFLWRPGLSELKRHQMDLSKKASELIQLERDARDWPDTITREKLTQYEEKLELLWDLIPTEEGISLLLDEVQNHAIVSGLEIASLKREASPKPSPGLTTEPGKTSPSRYEKVSYQILLRGSYYGLVQFLRKLEDSNRLITVSKIDSRANSIENPLQWSYSMEAEVSFSIFYSKVGVEKV